MRRCFLLILLLFLVACAPDRASPSSATAVPAEQASITPTATLAVSKTTATVLPAETQVPDGDATTPPSPTTPPPATASPLPSPTAALATAGHTAEGAYYLGDPAAPVTIIDYSDFM